MPVSSAYTQKERHIGIGKTKVINITPEEAKNLSRDKAKFSAKEEFGSFVFSESILRIVETEGYSREIFANNSTILFATQMKLIEESISYKFENNEQTIIVTAEYEIDRGKFERNIERFLKKNSNTNSLQNVITEIARSSSEEREEKESEFNIILKTGKEGESKGKIKEERKKVKIFIHNLDEKLRRKYIYEPSFLKEPERNIGKKLKKMEYSINWKWTKNTSLTNLFNEFSTNIVNDGNSGYVDKQLRKLSRKHKIFKLKKHKGKINYSQPFRQKKRRADIYLSFIKFKRNEKQKTIAKKVIARREKIRHGYEKIDFLKTNVNLADKTMGYSLYQKLRLVTRPTVLFEGSYNYEIDSIGNYEGFYGGSAILGIRSGKFSLGIGLDYNQNYSFGDKLSALLDMRLHTSKSPITSFFVLQGGITVPVLQEKPNNNFNNIFNNIKETLQNQFENPNIKGYFGEFRWGPKLGPLIISLGIRYNFFKGYEDITTPVEMKEQLLFIAKMGISI